MKNALICSKNERGMSIKSGLSHPFTMAISNHNIDRDNYLEVYIDGEVNVSSNKYSIFTIVPKNSKVYIKGDGFEISYQYLNQGWKHINTMNFKDDTEYLEVVSED